MCSHTVGLRVQASGEKELLLGARVPACPQEDEAVGEVQVVARRGAHAAVPVNKEVACVSRGA